MREGWGTGRETFAPPARRPAAKIPVPPEAPRSDPQSPGKGKAPAPIGGERGKSDMPALSWDIRFQHNGHVSCCGQNFRKMRMAMPVLIPPRCQVVWGKRGGMDISDMVSRSNPTLLRKGGTHQLPRTGAAGSTIPGLLSPSALRRR